MSIRSLLAIQNPGLGGPIGIPENNPYFLYDQGAIDFNTLVTSVASGTTPSTPSTVVTQSPEEALALSRRFAFLAATRPGFDYGMRSGERNAFFNRESGLGLDIFGAIVESVKKTAPEAFKGIKGSELLPKITGGPRIATGIKLPSWLPRISVPKPWQDAAKAAAQVAKKAAADVAAKKKAEAASKSTGVAAQTEDFGSPESPIPTMNPWIIGGALLLIVGGATAWRRK